GAVRPPRHGRRADHPLPTPARRAQARSRPRHDGRADRAVGRDGDRRDSRARRLRRVPRARRRQLMSVDVHTKVLDTAAVKAQFPLLARRIDGRPLHYLDSANTSQKPRCVIDTMTRFTETRYAPINRSAYRLAAEATDDYEAARAKVARFVNARH